MTSDLIIGLRLSAIGLSVTFLALGLVILVIDLLMRIFPSGRAAKAGDQRKIATSALDLDEKRREETAVALAVGVALLENQGAPEERDPTLGKLLE
jgi:hypothetical protein